MFYKNKYLILPVLLSNTCLQHRPGSGIYNALKHLLSECVNNLNQLLVDPYTNFLEISDAFKCLKNIICKLE